MGLPKVRVFVNKQGEACGVEVDGVKMDFLTSIKFDANVDLRKWHVNLIADFVADSLEVVEQ